MTARRRDTHTADLFATPQPAIATPGSMYYSQEVACLVSDVLRTSGRDRFEVAAEISRLKGRDVTKAMLDAWSSESREGHNLPFYMAPVLETVCHTHALTQWLCEKRGARALIGREALTAELGKLENIKDEAARKIRELKKLMGEHE